MRERPVSSTSVEPSGKRFKAACEAIPNYPSGAVTAPCSPTGPTLPRQETREDETMKSRKRQRDRPSMWSWSSLQTKWNKVVQRGSKALQLLLSPSEDHSGVARQIV
eukprot:Trichotokara_eunicae@DN1932_c0_g1_i2.p1